MAPAWADDTILETFQQDRNDVAKRSIEATNTVDRSTYTVFVSSQIDRNDVANTALLKVSIAIRSLPMTEIWSQNMTSPKKSTGCRSVALALLLFAVVMQGDAYLFSPPRRVQWWGSLVESPLPASSLNRNSRNTTYHVRVTVRSPLSDTPAVVYKFHFHMTLERKKQTPLLRLSAGPSVVNSGHGPGRSLARARARPPMRAVPQCRTRVSSRRSSGYQEPAKNAS